MAAKERKIDPVLAAANVALAERLMAKLEDSYRNGRLAPVNPNAKSVAMEVRVKAKPRQTP